ncbi:uncharacterized protein I206_107264 [Kwoniella pini CBS 10737]|uniref:RRM domain-containing protein n=1 Tax=Kwoniella pini CBS 10737 TaxID=1296096 RepID=A0A1B9HYT2_9TREE|nr:uncharacterized protein I206_05191 [Kwoniella pini CBS 10737]OCF48414.1 hypothetical protein I206_05191 [Kwoniella pini CBS 10737]
MKRQRDTSSSSQPSSSRPRTRPKLDLSHWTRIQSPRHFSQSAPALNRYRSDHLKQPQILAEDEYSAPSRMESFCPSSSERERNVEISNDQNDGHNPSNYDFSDDLPPLTHSPTPPSSTSESEYIFVDNFSLRPLLGWTTVKRINYKSRLVNNTIIGISETNVQINNLTAQVFSGMADMKAVVWQMFRPCGKIISITVFREYENLYFHNIQVDFEDAGGATRALSLHRIYFHNLLWRKLRITRKTYNQANWRLVRPSELPRLQNSLLNLNKLNTVLPARFEAEYSGLFPTNDNVIPLRRFEEYRSFTELGDVYTPLILTFGETTHDRGSKFALAWSTPSPSSITDGYKSDIKDLAKTNARKAEILKRIQLEKARNGNEDQVHSDLLELMQHRESFEYKNPLRSPSDKDRYTAHQVNKLGRPW